MRADHHRSATIQQRHQFDRFLLGFLHHRPHDLQEDAARVPRCYEQAIDGHGHMEEGGHCWRDIRLLERHLGVDWSSAVRISTRQPPPKFGLRLTVPKPEPAYR